MISQAISLSLERVAPHQALLYMKTLDAATLDTNVRIVVKEGYTQVWIPGMFEPYLFPAGWSGEIKLRPR